MNSDFVVYVDFDSTLYDTRRFLPDFFTMMGQLAGVTAGAIASSAEKFALHEYDYAAHVAHYGLNPAVMWENLAQLLTNNDYLYPDSHEFIQSIRRQKLNPKILSFGEKQFQYAKIVPTLEKLAGDTKNLPEVMVVNYKKHRLIRDLHKGQRGVLIDDIPDQKLPAGFTEIHIDRQSNLSAPRRKNDSYSVSNLLQAQQVINKLLTQIA